MRIFRDLRCLGSVEIDMNDNTSQTIFEVLAISHIIHLGFFQFSFLTIPESIHWIGKVNIQNRTFKLKKIKRFLGIPQNYASVKISGRIIKNENGEYLKIKFIVEWFYITGLILKLIIISSFVILLKNIPEAVWYIFGIISFTTIIEILLIKYDYVISKKHVFLLIEKSLKNGGKI